MAQTIFPSAEVARAQKNRGPMVALESTVITHGLPYPQNLQLARDMEAIVRRGGATPATIGAMGGKFIVGMSDDEMVRLAQSKNNVKISHRDMAAAVIQKASGGTTVASTMLAAADSSIRVFATGGIGGVHRGNSFDVSTDLRAMSRISIVVVCAGAKAILDLPNTLEYLETLGVPVVGYRTNDFPAFYSRTSGLEVSVRLDSAKAIADLATTHWSMGLLTAVLVVNPVPDLDAIPRSEIEPIIDKAVKEAEAKKIHGQALTPFLLQRVSELTAHRSMRANLSLLRNNAQLAAEIAVAMASAKK